MSDNNAVAACNMYVEKIKHLELELDATKEELRKALDHRETMLIALVSIEYDNWCEHFKEGNIPYGKTCPTCISKSALKEIEDNIPMSAH